MIICTWALEWQFGIWALEHLGAWDTWEANSAEEKKLRKRLLPRYLPYIYLDETLF